MKIKKVLILICASALVCALGFTVLAAATENGADTGEESENSFWGFRMPWFGKNADSNLTDEQKTEIENKMSEIQSIIDSTLTDEQKAERTEKQEQMKSKRTEMENRMSLQKEQWDGLTAEQKEELYSLQDKTIEAQIAVIDKYLELGVIDEETAQSMKDRLVEGNTYMRENDGMPGLGRGHRGGFGHGR